MSGDSYHWDIEELLHRRTDLSTFVVHWSRDFGDDSALENLKSILDSRTLFAKTAFGSAVTQLENIEDAVERAAARESQKVVCFTEAPLEQAWSFVCEIAGRTTPLQPYGVAFTKQTARGLGVNPVLYMDMTPGHDWKVTKAAEALVKRAIESGEFLSDPISRLAPFLDWMGTWPSGKKKEFWWEREWRHLGDLEFSIKDVAVIFCPENDFEVIGNVLDEIEPSRKIHTLDPIWGLEHFIKRLADLE
ncbi:MAG: hypothetical protein IIC86_03010 [Chloroflexi bacterium]|nr:hypothetical protein [Chloroflexota bacterium]